MTSASAPETPLLEVENLSVRYGHVEAVRDVSLRVAPGEFVSIIGNNGAGKSSTLKAVAGVVRPSGGRVRIRGRETNGLPTHRIVQMGVCLVPEGRMIFSDQTVLDNLLLGAYSRNRAERKSLNSDLDRAFELFPILKERRDQIAGSLSGGEQQMLALSRGLLSHPELLMIDEMSLGLAPKVLETMFPALERLNRSGIAILLVEQLATMALRVADRGYVFENSRIVLSGPASELARDEQVVRAYLGRRAA